MRHKGERFMPEGWQEESCSVTRSGFIRCSIRSVSKGVSIFATGDTKHLALNICIKLAVEGDKYGK